MMKKEEMKKFQIEKFCFEMKNGQKLKIRGDGRILFTNPFEDVGCRDNTYSIIFITPLFKDIKFERIFQL